MARTNGIRRAHRKGPEIKIDRWMRVDIVESLKLRFKLWLYSRGSSLFSKDMNLNSLSILYYDHLPPHNTHAVILFAGRKSCFGLHTTRSSRIRQYKEHMKPAHKSNLLLRGIMVPGNLVMKNSAWEVT